MKLVHVKHSQKPSRGFETVAVRDLLNRRSTSELEAHNG